MDVFRGVDLNILDDSSLLGKMLHNQFFGKGLSLENCVTSREGRGYWYCKLVANAK